MPGDEPGSMLNSGLIQLLGILIPAIAAYGVAKFSRSGAREANQTTGWTNLVAALQKEVEDFRIVEDKTEVEMRELIKGNQDLTKRVLALERSRHRWKWWGNQVVEVMRGQGVAFPPPPEPLTDTDP